MLIYSLSGKSPIREGKGLNTGVMGMPASSAVPSGVNISLVSYYMAGTAVPVKHARYANGMESSSEKMLAAQHLLFLVFVLLCGLGAGLLGLEKLHCCFLLAEGTDLVLNLLLLVFQLLLLVLVRLL